MPKPVIRADVELLIDLYGTARAERALLLSVAPSSVPLSPPVAIIAAHAALLSAFDVLAERARVAESAIAAVSTFTDVPAAVQAFNRSRGGPT